MPPKSFKSMKSAYSLPNPNVPDAAITGLFNFNPAIFTDILKSFLLLIKNHLTAPEYRSILAYMTVLPVFPVFCLTGTDEAGSYSTAHPLFKRNLTWYAMECSYFRYLFYRRCWTAGIN